MPAFTARASKVIRNPLGASSFRTITTSCTAASSQGSITPMLTWRATSRSSASCIRGEYRRKPFTYGTVKPSFRVIPIGGTSASPPRSSVAWNTPLSSSSGSSHARLRRPINNSSGPTSLGSTKSGSRGSVIDRASSARRSLSDWSASRSTRLAVRPSISRTSGSPWGDGVTWVRPSARCAATMARISANRSNSNIVINPMVRASRSPGMT